MTLSLLLYGSSGVGKTSLSLTGPGPTLIADTGGAASHLHRVVNGEVERPSKCHWQAGEEWPEDCDDVIIYDASSWELLLLLYEEILAGTCRPNTLVIDSLTEAQRRLKDYRFSGSAQLGMQEWGVVLAEMQSLLRRFRDLTIGKDPAIEVLVFTSLASTYDGETRPDLQGALARQIPELVDVVGYLKLGKNKAEKDCLRMLVAETDTRVAKSNPPEIRMLGPLIENPTITQLLAAIPKES